MSHCLQLEHLYLCICSRSACGITHSLAISLVTINSTCTRFKFPPASVLNFYNGIGAFIFNHTNHTVTYTCTTSDIQLWNNHLIESCVIGAWCRRCCSTSRCSSSSKCCLNCCTKGIHALETN